MYNGIKGQSSSLDSSQASFDELDILLDNNGVSRPCECVSAEPSFTESLDYFTNPQTLTDAGRQGQLKNSIVKLLAPMPEDPKRKAAINAEKAIAEAEAVEVLAGDAGFDFSAANISDRITELREELYSKDLTNEDIEALNAELEALYMLCGSVHGALEKYMSMPEAELGTNAADGLKDLLTLLDEFVVNPSKDILDLIGETGEEVAKELTTFELANFIIPASVAKEVFDEAALKQMATAVKDPLARASIGFAMIEDFYNSSDIPEYAKANPDALLERLEKAKILNDDTLKAAGLNKLSGDIRAIGRDIRTGRITQEEGNEQVLIKMGEAATGQAAKVRNGMVANLEEMVLNGVDLNAGKEEARQKYLWLRKLEREATREKIKIYGSIDGIRPVMIKDDRLEERETTAVAKDEAEFEEMWSEHVAEQEREWKAAVKMATFEVRSDIGNEINGIENSVSFSDIVERQEKIAKMLEEKGGKNSVEALVEGTLLVKTYLSGQLLAKEVSENDNMTPMVRDYANDSFGLSGSSLMEIAHLDKNSSIGAIKNARLKMEEVIKDISRAVILANGYSGIAKFYTTVGIIILAAMTGVLAAQAAVELGAVAEGGIGAFFVDATAFGLADTALTAAAFKEYPKTFGEFAVKMVHTYATFGALRGMGKAFEPFVGSAKEGLKIINDSEKLFGELTAKELRSVAMVFGGCPKVSTALAIDAAQIASSHATLQATSGVLGSVGIGEVPEGFGTWEDILTLAILHYHGKMKEGKERIFTTERIEHKEPATFVLAIKDARENGFKVVPIENGFKVYVDVLDSSRQRVQRPIAVHRLEQPVSPPSPTILETRTRPGLQVANIEDIGSEICGFGEGNENLGLAIVETKGAPPPPHDEGTYFIDRDLKTSNSLTNVTPMGNIEEGVQRQLDQKRGRGDKSPVRVLIIGAGLGTTETGLKEKFGNDVEITAFSKEDEVSNENRGAFKSIVTGDLGTDPFPDIKPDIVLSVYGGTFHVKDRVLGFQKTVDSMSVGSEAFIMTPIIDNGGLDYLGNPFVVNYFAQLGLEIRTVSPLDANGNAALRFYIKKTSPKQIDVKKTLNEARDLEKKMFKMNPEEQRVFTEKYKKETGIDPTPGVRVNKDDFIRRSEEDYKRKLKDRIDKEIKQYNIEIDEIDRDALLRDILTHVGFGWTVEEAVRIEIQDYTNWRSLLARQQANEPPAPSRDEIRRDLIKEGNYIIDRDLEKSDSFTRRTPMGNIEEGVQRQLDQKRAKGDTSPVKVLVIGAGVGATEAGLKKKFGDDVEITAFSKEDEVSAENRDAFKSIVTGDIDKDPLPDVKPDIVLSVYGGTFHAGDPVLGLQKTIDAMPEGSESFVIVTIIAPHLGRLSDPVYINYFDQLGLEIRTTKLVYGNPATLVYIRKTTSRQIDVQRTIEEISELQDKMSNMSPDERAVFVKQYKKQTGIDITRGLRTEKNKIIPANQKDYDYVKELPGLIDKEIARYSIKVKDVDRDKFISNVETHIGDGWTVEEAVQVEMRSYAEKHGLDTPQRTSSPETGWTKSAKRYLKWGVTLPAYWFTGVGGVGAPPPPPKDNAGPPPQATTKAVTSEGPDFQTRLQGYNERLKSFDEASSLKRAGKELSAEQQKVVDEASLQALSSERQRFVSENYKEHTIATANNPNSQTYKHLEAHLNAVDLGSFFEFGSGRTFDGPSSLIEFSEGWLAKAYKGDIKPGNEVRVTVQSKDGPVNGTVRFMQVGEIADGLSVGPSGVGGRVVVKVTFDKPVGRNGIKELTGGENVLHADRLSGGRKEAVNVIDGKAGDSNTFYIIGGAYGPTGKFGLFTAYTGSYSPPMNDKAYWDKHAFLTGDAETSFKTLTEGKVLVRSGSTLDKMMAEGKIGISGDIKTVQALKVNNGHQAGQGKADKVAQKFEAAKIDLRARGLLTPEIEKELEDYVASGGDVEHVRSALTTAAGNSGPDRDINAFNAIRGLQFEIKRNKEVKEGLTDGGQQQAAQKAKVRIKYHGIRKAGDDWVLAEKASEIDLDVPVLGGHIYEVKSYPRRNWGGDNDAKMLEGALNQAIKYNEAVKAGLFKGATIEIRGNVSPELIRLLGKWAPEVEVLYCLELPSGNDVAFRLKKAPDNRPTLRRVPDIYDLPEGERLVVDGIRRLMQSGRIFKDDVFQSSFLKLKDIDPQNKFYEELKAASNNEGSINPLKIINLEVYREWERLIYEKRLKYFSDMLAALPLHRSTEHLREAVTDEVVDNTYGPQKGEIIKASDEFIDRLTRQKMLASQFMAFLDEIWRHPENLTDDQKKIFESHLSPDQTDKFRRGKLDAPEFVSDQTHLDLLKILTIEQKQAVWNKVVVDPRRRRFYDRKRTELAGLYSAVRSTLNELGLDLNGQKFIDIAGGAGDATRVLVGSFKDSSTEVLDYDDNKLTYANDLDKIFGQQTNARKFDIRNEKIPDGIWVAKHPCGDLVEHIVSQWVVEPKSPVLFVMTCCQGSAKNYRDANGNPPYGFTKEKWEELCRKSDWTSHSDPKMREEGYRVMDELDNARIKYLRDMGYNAKLVKINGVSKGNLIIAWKD